MFQPWQVEKIAVDGTPGLKVTTTMPRLPNAPPQQIKMTERTYGPGGKFVYWTAPCDRQTVVLSYMSLDRLRHIITAIKRGTPGLAAGVEIPEAAALPPPETTWKDDVSPQGVVDFYFQSMTWTMPSDIGLKAARSWSDASRGRGPTGGPDEVEAHLIVPAEVVKAIARQAQGGQQGPAAEKEAGKTLDRLFLQDAQGPARRPSAPACGKRGTSRNATEAVLVGAGSLLVESERSRARIAQSMRGRGVVIAQLAPPGLSNCRHSSKQFTCSTTSKAMITLRRRGLEPELPPMLDVAHHLGRRHKVHAHVMRPDPPAFKCRPTQPLPQPISRIRASLGMGSRK